MEIEVKGHSGCPIDIVREGSDLFIYKSSYDKNYLDRLERQARKQQEAWKQEYQHIRIPEIFNIVHDDEHVSIKMEYVYSRNFIEYFETAGFEQIDYFIKALILFIERELQSSPLQLVKTSKTLDKFVDVKSKILGNPLLADDIDIAHLIKESERKFAEFTKLGYIKIPLGICHGDLTFSNILFNGNNYYLIDFLDSFIESPLLDIVKIRQDSAHLWSQLMYTKSYDRLRLKIICNKIDRDVDKYFQKYDWYNNFYVLYQLLNLLRILQYAKEKKVISYLKKEIAKVLKVEAEACHFRNYSLEKTKQSDKFSLIVPAAADSEEHPEAMPYIFSLDSSGIMLCLRSIQGLNLKVFDNIYFTILRKHAEKFCLKELFEIQFRRLGLNNVRLVILDEPTQSQTETVYRTLIQEDIGGGIFIKDADGIFRGEIRRENGIAIYPLEQMTIVNPRNKSYVTVDDMYYITNVIEKRVVGHYFNAGGSCFENASDFIVYYRTLSQNIDKVFISHIIYQMLLNKNKFRPIEVTDFKDWGNRELFEYYIKK